MTVPETVAAEEAVRQLVAAHKDLREEFAVAQDALAEAATAQAGAEERIDVLEAEAAEFIEAMERAHELARHRGPWKFCQDPVCSAMEEWLHHRRKAG